METESQLHAKDYINNLAADGRYHFTSRDARETLGVSADATKMALGKPQRNRFADTPAGA